MKAFSRNEMRELDRKTIEDVSIPGLILMENAGRGAAAYFRDYFLKSMNKSIESSDLFTLQNVLAGVKVLIVNGKGNNGGDGFVIARHLHNWGADVKVVLLGSGNELRAGSDAETNYKIAKSMGLSILEIVEEKTLLSFDFSRFDVILDGIFGTGLTREIRGISRFTIEKINEQANLLKFAIDLPSGLDADTGEVLGICMKADATATFGGLKLGMTKNKGLEYSGEVKVIDISIPRELYES